jgi:hypothetical protein
MVIWPHKLQPHLLEKYDGTINSTKFLQIYSISILRVGGDEAIMANYFLGALTVIAWSWPMNLPEGIKRQAVKMAAPNAQCTTPHAIVRVSAGRSRSSWNSSVERSSNHTKKVRLPASGRANKRWTLRRRKGRRWSSRMLEGVEGRVW